jgi:hypothetical protein
MNTTCYFRKPCKNRNQEKDRYLSNFYMLENNINHILESHLTV